MPMDASAIRQRLLGLRNLLVNSAWGEEARKLWEGLLEACLSMADRLAELEASQEDFALYLEAIDEDLALLEAALAAGGEDEEEEEEGAILDLVCPHCHRPITLRRVIKAGRPP